MLSEHARPGFSHASEQSLLKKAQPANPAMAQTMFPMIGTAVHLIDARRATISQFSVLTAQSSLQVSHPGTCSAGEPRRSTDRLKHMP
jgi:hypothetical protein